MTGGRRSSHHKAILYGNVWHTTTCLTSKLRELKQTVLGKEPSMVAHVPKHEAEQVEQVVSTSLEQPTHVAKHEPEQVEQVVVSTSLEQSTHVPKQKAEQVEQVVSTSLEQSTHVPKHEPEQVEQVVSTSLEQSTQLPKQKAEQVEQVVSTSLEQTLPSKEPSMVAQVPRQELQHRVSEPVLHTPGKRHRSPSPTPVKVLSPFAAEDSRGNHFASRVPQGA